METLKGMNDALLAERIDRDRDDRSALTSFTAVIKRERLGSFAHESITMPTRKILLKTHGGESGRKEESMRLSAAALALLPCGMSPIGGTL